jgi:hypothetical protein
VPQELIVEGRRRMGQTAGMSADRYVRLQNTAGEKPKMRILTVHYGNSLKAAYT